MAASSAQGQSPGFPTPGRPRGAGIRTWPREGRFWEPAAGRAGTTPGPETLDGSGDSLSTQSRDLRQSFCAPGERPRSPSLGAPRLFPGSRSAEGARPRRGLHVAEQDSGQGGGPGREGVVADWLFTRSRISKCTCVCLDGDRSLGSGECPLCNPLDLLLGGPLSGPVLVTPHRHFHSGSPPAAVARPGRSRGQIVCVDKTPTLGRRRGSGRYRAQTTAYFRVAGPLTGFRLAITKSTQVNTCKCGLGTGVGLSGPRSGLAESWRRCLVAFATQFFIVMVSLSILSSVWS